MAFFVHVCYTITYEAKDIVFSGRGYVMAVKTRLPMGIENFKEMRKRGYYYIDKTELIRDLLENFGKVNLFARPRRFGKSLNMSMLKNFF